MTDDFNINQDDYSFLLENIDNEIEIVVEDFIQLDLKELSDLLSEDFELELIPSAIPTEKSTAEEETKKLKKTEERLITKFTCPKCHNKYLRESNFKKHEKKCYIGTKGVFILTCCGTECLNWCYKYKILVITPRL